METENNSKFPKLVIIGGGFGGIELAKHLDDKPVDIIMLDKHNYHTFQPLLYQVATGGLEADSIAFPLRKIFEGQKNFRFRIAEVTKIRPGDNSIDTTIGEIKYDYLVIATGSTTNFFGNKQIEHFSMPMKSIPEALNLRSMILQNLEEAILQNGKEAREPYMNFVVVGAGPTGVELSGAIAELRNHILHKDYPELNKDEMKVYLVEGLPKVLQVMSEQASSKSTEFLKEIGVEVLTNVTVKDYDGKEIKLGDGKSIKTHNVIWSAGVMGQVIDGLPKEGIVKGNRIQTDEINRVNGQTNIFAIGDVAAIITPDTPKGHPGVAQVAIQQGTHLAKNLIKIIDGQPAEPFKYNDKGSLATIGRNKAVADIGKIRFQGFFAWLVWMFVHLISLAGFRNRVVVFINWIGSYFSYNGGTRLIIRKFIREEIVATEHLPKAND
ncbi:NADH dehydrogenase FAD-containing subunit [Mucilaginibacter gracilis]|uniref:NADH:ubiquinone reductase (non-electrogenic) n=1 Tax=Mucilaginibacter gracilis TaxID=423350 RepID=A0A495J8D1_9SPHI|nr:NAD(P)/FAD-dependent oxidoreductase [Mucilaginibacter gracilis]RKR85250.1 NADH dehydrogenase FAD-containing subunit [Mucilaginibacter gracilis]